MGKSPTPYCTDAVADGDAGANVILAHFHYCNKGRIPFSEECEDKDLRALAQLDEEKIRFVRATRGLVQRHRKYPIPGPHHTLHQKPKFPNLC